MNIIQKLLEEIENTDTSTINWKDEKFQIDDNEKEIGKTDEFELKCLAFLQRRKLEHKKDHQAINDLFNVPDGDTEKMRKVFQKRKTDKNFITALEKLQYTCKAFQEERSIVKELLWYSVGNKFPEKHIDAIFIREKGIITFDKEYEIFIKTQEIKDHIIGEFMEVLKSEHPFSQINDTFPFMHFGTSQGEA
jgi:hypothetical protein